MRMSTEMTLWDLGVLEKQGMSLKGKPGMSPKGNEGCHHHSSERCSPRSPLFFQQHILIDHPAPVALLAFCQGQGHVSHIPRNVLSQQRHFPFQWDYPDTMEGLSELFSSCAVSPLHFSLDKSACFTPSPLPRGCHGLQP